MNDESNRIFRGCSWLLHPSLARVVYRIRGAPGDRGEGIGVRLVRVIDTLQRIAEVNNEP